MRTGASPPIHCKRGGRHRPRAATRRKARSCEAVFRVRSVSFKEGDRALMGNVFKEGGKEVAAQRSSAIGDLFAQKPRGFENQDDDQDAEGQNIDILAAQKAARPIAQIARADGFDQAQNQAA